MRLILKPGTFLQDRVACPTAARRSGAACTTRVRAPSARRPRPSRAAGGRDARRARRPACRRSRGSRRRSSRRRGPRECTNVPRVGDGDALAAAAIAVGIRVGQLRHRLPRARRRSSRSRRARPPRGRRPPPSPSPRSRSTGRAWPRSSPRRSRASARPACADSGCHTVRAAASDRGRIALERREDGGRREREHARVPHVVAGGEVLARLRERRLLDEAARPRTRAPRSARAALDVAVARSPAASGVMPNVTSLPVARQLRGARHRRRRTRLRRGSGDRPPAPA